MPELRQFMAQGFWAAGGKTPAALIESLYEEVDEETGEVTPATGQAKELGENGGATEVAIGIERYLVYPENEKGECLVLREMY